jgi:acyl carrier protein
LKWLGGKVRHFCQDTGKLGKAALSSTGGSPIKLARVSRELSRGMTVAMIPIENELFGLIQKKTGVRPQLDDSFDTLQIDSLGMAELTVEIEKVFGIRIHEDVMDVTNIAELIAYIENKVGVRGAS